MKGEMPQREKLPPVSEQMKARSAALVAELRGWPQVTRKSFSGYTALCSIQICYRGKTTFGLLPRARRIFKGNAVAFRLDRGNRSAQTLLTKDSRIVAFDKEKTR